MEPVRLTEGDITVRPWHTDDIEACRLACQDPDIQRWTMVPAPYHRRHAERFITEGAAAAWSAGTGAPLAVADTASDRLVGSAGLVALDRAAGTAEIGYWTAPWARGRSLAVRAGRLVARWAFAEAGVRRLEWRAEVGNHASRMVALRLGVQVEGVVRSALATRDGGAVDGWLGAMLADELTDDDTDDTTRRRASRQARTFAAAQPSLPADELLLRPLTAADVPDMVATYRDPDSIAYTGVPDPYEPEHAEAFIRLSELAWVAGTGAHYAIEAGGRYAGQIDLSLGPWPARIANLGYAVAPWARGLGTATTAARAVAGWGFDALALDRIEWRAFTGNDASRRVAEKAGFTIEGTEHGRLIHRGEEIDTWYGALLRAGLNSGQME